MPIVISYEDVEALGSLAYNTGEVTGRAGQQNRDLALLTSIDQNRDATATRLQQIEASERQRELDRQLQASTAASTQQYRYDALAQQDDFNQARLQAGIAEAQARSQGQLTETMLDASLRSARDKQLHEQTLERLEREAQLGKYARSGTPQPGISAGGFPNQRQVDAEIQQFGHLIPFGARDAVTTESAGRSRERAIDTAKNVGAMPTSQIEGMIQERPDDPWNPYLRAVVEARKQSSGETGFGQQSGMAEGRSLPKQASAATGGSFNRGQSMVTPLSGLTDEQLQAASKNPELLRQLLAQQGR